MSIKNKAKDRDDNGKIKRKYTGPAKTWKAHCPDGCPKAWRKLQMTRPLRHQDKQLCRFISKGNNSDGLYFNLGNHKPHVYYW